jgi:hypothetical protein
MSLWAAAGISLETTSRMTGHSSYSFSAHRYQHLFATTAADAADAVRSLVPRRHPHDALTRARRR